MAGEPGQSRTDSSSSTPPDCLLQAEISTVRPLNDFDVVVWAIAPDEGQRAAYADAGATVVIEGLAPGDDWLDDAAEIAMAGPPNG